MQFSNNSINWLYNNQLRVDAEWSVATKTGFTWWGHRHAQTIEVVGEEVMASGQRAYLIAVRTDMLCDLALDAEVLRILNTEIMPFVSMSGPVYDRQSGRLRLGTLVRVHAGIAEWMNPLISLASVLQLAEVVLWGPQLAEQLGAGNDESAHPENGFRPVADELAGIACNLVIPRGRMPCSWPAAEFAEVVAEYMQRPPALLASHSKTGLTVEFPYGEKDTSLLRIAAEQHPVYGNGLLLLQSFPPNGLDDVAGAELVLKLNAEELAGNPAGYGFGSHVFTDGMVHFCTFIPNAAYRPGMLLNYYLACATRARRMSVQLSGCDWTDGSYDPMRSAAHKLMTRRDRPRK